MQHKHPSSSHSIHGAFIFLLIGLFAVSAVTLTLIGTRVYRRVTDSSTQNSGAQVVLSYLCNKVRTFDAQGGVQLAQRDALPALCLYETIEGEPYETAIYAYQGSIWERFASRSEPFDPKGGERLTEAKALDFSLLSANLLQATVVMPDGETRTLRMALRAGSAKEAN